MALIKCPECDKELSDKAKSCPHCGCPLIKQSKYKIIVNGYVNTDTEALAGLNITFSINLSYYEGMEILNDCPYNIIDCDTEEEAIGYIQQLEQYGINASIIQPGGIVVLDEELQIKCPTCGSTRVKRISLTSKAVGAVMFGLFSKTAKSQFECLDCKYKW